MTTVAFDADVIICSADPDNVLRADILQFFERDGIRRVGSGLLLTEVLARPMRAAASDSETAFLYGMLARIELLPFDVSTARLALALAVKYGLRGADSAHLATAVAAGADQFFTNNRKDFPTSISEIDIVYRAQHPSS